jgi:subtilase family serine protease
VYTEGALYIFGGTSCGTPVFAGMAALLNQYLAVQGASAQTGLGNINPNLYRLAETTTDVFHDVTAGDNIETCVQGSPNCVDGRARLRRRPRL